MKNKVITSEKFVRVPKDWGWVPLSDRFSKNFENKLWCDKCQDFTKHIDRKCINCMSEREKFLNDLPYDKTKVKVATYYHSGGKLVKK